MARRKVLLTPKEPPINTYGFTPLRPLSNGVVAQQIHYDQMAFSRRLDYDRTGMTRAQLYRRVSDAFIPKYHEWTNEWTDRKINALCERKWLAMSGCSSSGKTHDVAGFMSVWWLCDPFDSSVIFCSTTKGALRRRGWANIMRCEQIVRERNNGQPFGNFVNSEMRWECRKGDAKNAIIGIAVEEGATAKVADNIKGHHTRRQAVVVDEATAVPEAIMDAVSNLYSYPSQTGGEFILVMMGNPRDRLDQFGRFCEPKDGWSSVTVDTEEWETTEKLDGQSGLVLRFDATRSPNIVAGKRVSIHLPTQEMVDAAIRAHGSENHPAFWSNMRGFWPPEGITSTVFTQSELMVKHAFDKTTFTGESHMFAGVDPAFSSGGDRAIFKPARAGITKDGPVIQLLPHITLKLDAQSTTPIGYQLCEQIRKHCESLGIPPENMCIDATGEGGTLCDIMYREWVKWPMQSFIRVEFSNKASERPVSHEDARPSSQVYRNKACELWFQAREFVNSGQIRGMDKDLASELCTREYVPESGVTTKRELESKTEMRSRTNKSPDLADAFVLVCEAARRRGVRIQAVGHTAGRTTDLEREQRTVEQAMTQGLYSASNANEEIFVDDDALSAYS